MKNQLISNIKIS